MSRARGQCLSRAGVGGTAVHCHFHGQLGVLAEGFWGDHGPLQLHGSSQLTHPGSIKQATGRPAPGSSRLRLGGPSSRQARRTHTPRKRERESPASIKPSCTAQSLLRGVHKLKVCLLYLLHGCAFRRAVMLITDLPRLLG